MVDNVILDEELAIGFTGGPTFSTDKMLMVNGQERRFQNRTVAIHSYRYGFRNKHRSEIAELKAFFMDRRGDFKSWLLKDWGDFSATAEVIGVGDGVTRDFQLVKTYTAGFNPYTRIIRHLKAGTIVIKIAGAVQDNSGSPNAYHVSSTGLVSFATPPAVGSITWDGEFYVPVRFDGDTFPISVDYPDDLDVLSVNDLVALEIIP
jgi:uncharacterized protein (TIGR02217 family)